MSKILPSLLIPSIDNTANIILFPLLIRLDIQRQLLLISPHQILNDRIGLKRQFLATVGLSILEAGTITASEHFSQKLRDIGEGIVFVNGQFYVFLDIKGDQVDVDAPTHPTLDYYYRKQFGKTINQSFTDCSIISVPFITHFVISTQPKNYILSQSTYMDVTTSNFREAIKIIEHILPNTEYIAFDLQFSGLKFQNFERDHINYLPFQKYKKLKYVAQTYQIMQLGISFVTYEDRLKVYPFNFYLFPRNPVSYDKNINLQLGCVKFNTDCGMDWNKWIREGVNYVTIAQMQQAENYSRNITERMLLENLSVQNQNNVFLFLREVDRIAKGPDNLTHSFQMSYYNFKILSNIFYKHIEERNLDVSIQYMPGKSKDAQDFIIITKISRAAKSADASQRKADLYGFALIFQKIWGSKKPIIGHNCFLDLLYLYHSLVGRLPQNYFEFKENLRRSGNSFYDTKYMALCHPEIFGPETKLEDLLKYIRINYANKLTTISSQKGFDNYSLDNQSLHEAGYDSFVTIWVFMQMLKLKQGIEKYRNMININFSFFRLNISKDQDQINEYYAKNLLRINLDIEEKEDVKRKRMEVVKKIRQHFIEIDNFKAYHIHEGYREIFIEMKDCKKDILRCLAKMKAKKVITDIKTFTGYLDWQEERVRKAAMIDLYKQRSIRGKEEKKFYNKTIPKTQSKGEEREKMVDERDERPKRGPRLE